MTDDQVKRTIVCVPLFLMAVVCPVARAQAPAGTKVDFVGATGLDGASAPGGQEDSRFGHFSGAVLAGGFLEQGPASPQFSLYLDWLSPGGLDLFERGSYRTASHDAASRVSLSVPVAWRIKVAPGFVATHSPGLNLIRPSIGLTYVQAPRLLVYTNYLTRDRVGGQGITTGFEYVIPSRRRWRPEIEGDVSHYWPSGSTVESISMGIRF